MRVICSEDHRKHFPKGELYGGELVRPFPHIVEPERRLVLEANPGFTARANFAEIRACLQSADRFS